jgi:hypothetical protein
VVSLSCSGSETTTTTTTTEKTIMMIASKHPVRRAMCNLKTYWDSKAELLDAVIAACADHGVEAEPEDMPGRAGCVKLKLRPGNNAHVICDVCAEKHDRTFFDNYAIVSYYTMSMGGGCIELVAYIS